MTYYVLTTKHGTHSFYMDRMTAEVMNVGRCRGRGRVIACNYEELKQYLKK